jgi:beta-lactamase class A
MDAILADGIAALEADGRPSLKDDLSVTWLRYPSSPLAGAWGDGSQALAVHGASWAGERARYPASVVKLAYLVAAEAWLQRQWLERSSELERALAAMIQESSNDATGLVLDLLTGTTSGPELPPGPLSSWSEQRQLVNRWYGSLGWPQWQGCNACQKTWSDGPFGRERQSYGPDLANRNRLSTDFTARLLHGVISGALVSPLACQRMQALLARSLDPELRRADPENQVDGILGESLPQSARLWSKAGWMSQARHDAAYVEAEGHAPMLLVVFSEGERCAGDTRLLPEIASHLLDACRTAPAP